MKILGIESSCDETAASVVEDGKRLLSNVVNSQIDIHAAYGGVVPEIAARSHIEAVNPAIDQALKEANCTWDDIDAIAVTYAPGLIGSLLVGTLAARTLAILKNKPLYPIHHVEAHVYANFIIEQGPGVAASNLVLPSKQPEFPMLALIVSGGHTQLVLFKDHGDYDLLGQTLDDAVGEAFDKVAKIIGLPYPGGVSIDRAAPDGNRNAFIFPKAKLQGAYDFSFSGVKTAVLRAVQREVGKDITFPSHELPALLNDAQRNDFAASFQKVAVETLVDKAVRAYKDFSPASVVIAGGVAASDALRRELSARLPITIEYAPMKLCTDNAAMIATLGYYQAQHLEPCDPYALEVMPSISMTKTAWGKR
ncbi:MAG: tRNA (adenosine(37)-N6)-threonylcarbamoyltransferase complex transferase subunit TsaD [Candidatus Saccharimonas sp.]